MVSRAKLETVLRAQAPCIVAMEACATSHFWGRFAQSLGHEVRLIPPIYGKPFVKRQKNDAADAAAIAEAALRPNLHYVAVKSAEYQAKAGAWRTLQSFVGQRTQLINALRGHRGKFGLVVAQGGVIRQLARPRARAQAAYGGGSRARKQEGAQDLGDDDTRTELPDGVNRFAFNPRQRGTRLAAESPGKEIDRRLCGKDFNVPGRVNQARRASIKLSEPMWTSFFELHTGAWRRSGHTKRPDTRAIEAPNRYQCPNITLQNWGSNPRATRRDARWHQSCPGDRYPLGAIGCMLARGSNKICAIASLVAPRMDRQPQCATPSADGLPYLSRSTANARTVSPISARPTAMARLAVT